MLIRIISILFRDMISSLILMFFERNKCGDLERFLSFTYPFQNAELYISYLRQAFFITSLGDTGGETTPRRLSFFLEFWVFPLSFEFFP